MHFQTRPTTTPEVINTKPAEKVCPEHCKSITLEHASSNILHRDLSLYCAATLSPDWILGWYEHYIATCLNPASQVS